LEEFLKHFSVSPRAEFKVPTRTVQTIPSDTINLSNTIRLASNYFMLLNLWK